MISSERGIVQFLPNDVTTLEAELSLNTRITEHQCLKWSLRFLWHGPQILKGGLCMIFAKGGQVWKVAFVLLFSQKVAKPEKVVFVLIFSKKVANSVKTWPMSYDFCERWPSQQKGGHWCAIFAKGGQVSKNVANIIRFLRKVAKSVERWPLMCDFRRRWPLHSYFCKRWPS